MGFPLSFERPIALLLLPVVVAALWALARRSYAPLDAEQIKQTLCVRIAVASLIVLALAQPNWRVLSHDITVMYLLDASASMRPDQRAAANRFVTKSFDAKGLNDQAGVVVFGRYPNLETRPDVDAKISSGHAAVDGNATNLQAALKNAENAFPDGTGKKIVLLTDGKQNAGDAEAEIAALKQRNIQVDIAPVGLNPAQSPEVSVDSIRLPGHVEKDAPFPIRVILSSSVAEHATVALKRDGAAFGQVAIDLHPGKNVVAVTGRESVAGTHKYEAEVTAPQDSIAANNQAFGITDVRGIPRVLYIAEAADKGTGTMRTALGAQGVTMDVMAPGSAPKSVAEWQAYDSVVISNVAASDFSPDQMNSLRTSVKDFGTGLGMIGGVNSFGSGLYNETPVEEALPVDMRVPEKKRMPPVAVVIVLDASGSMSATEGGIEKVQLAAQAAVNLMKSLQPDDEVAVIAVTETPVVVVPFQPASRAASAAKLIQGLQAGGGGIYCRTGLQAAYSMLEPTRFPTRHVIMCADTTDSEEQEGCADMARAEFLANKITTSMIGIGGYGDPHVPFQKSVAAAGHGEMQAVTEAKDLPRMFARDVQSIKAALYVEKPFRPTYNLQDPLLSGIPFASEPPLLGYNIVTPKAGAVVPLTVPGDGDTLMAYWNYGLGRSFAFTSDDRAHWAAQWLSWRGFNPLWAQTIRWSMKNETNSGLQTLVDRDEGRGHIAVDAFTPSGDFVDSASLTAAVVGPDQTVVHLKLNQTAPGRYEAQFDADQNGIYMLNVQDSTRPGVAQTVGLAVPYSAEFQNSPPDTALLADLSYATGGRFLSSPDQVFHNTKLWEVGSVALTSGCLVLGALLFLIDIAWRRMGWKVRSRARLVVEPSTAGADADEGGPVPVASAPAARDWTAEAVIQRPKVRESTERETPSGAGAYLGRSASSRIGTDDDDFPFVATKDNRRGG